MSSKRSRTKKTDPPATPPDQAAADPAAESDVPVPDLGHIIDGLRSLAVPIGDLIPDPANAKQHGPKNIAGIAASLRAYKQRTPVVVNRKTMIVLKGNGTLRAALSLGWSHIAAVFAEDDPATAAGYSIADNRLSEIDVEWDSKALDQLLRVVQTEDEDLASMLDELAQDLGIVPGVEPSAEPPNGAASAEPPRATHQVVIDCRDEEHQKEVIGRCVDLGLDCRAVSVRSKAA